MPNSKRTQLASELVSALTDTTEQFQQLLDLAQRQPVVPHSEVSTATILEKLEVAWTRFIDCKGQLEQWPITASVSAARISRDHESAYFDACRLCLYLSDGSRGFANRRQQLVQVESEISSLVQKHADRFARLAFQLTSTTVSDWKPIVSEPHDPFMEQSFFHRVLQQDVGSRHCSVDEVVIGKQVISITGLSAKIIPGDTPSICLNASPKVQLETIEHIQPAIQAQFDVLNDRTIHWIGHQAGASGKCRCHPEAPYAEQWQAIEVSRKHCESLKWNLPAYSFDPTKPHFPRPRGYLGESFWNKTADAWPIAKAHLERFIQCSNDILSLHNFGSLPSEFCSWWIREWAEEFLQHSGFGNRDLEDIQALYHFARALDRQLHISDTPCDKQISTVVIFTYYDRPPRGDRAFICELEQREESSPPILSGPIPTGIFHTHGPFPRQTEKHQTLGWRLSSDGFLQYLDVFADPQELSEQKREFFARVGYSLTDIVGFGSAHDYLRNQPLERLQQAIRDYSDTSLWISVTTLDMSRRMNESLDDVKRWLAGCCDTVETYGKLITSGSKVKPKHKRGSPRLSQQELQKIRRLVEGYKVSGLTVREFVRNSNSDLLMADNEKKRLAAFDRCRKNYDNHFGKKSRQAE